MQRTFTIGDLSKEFGVTLRTLRFYEDKNLIHPRRQGPNRVYGRRERARLRLVLLGRKVGFSLDEIGEMLAFYDLREGDSVQLEMAQRRFSDQIEALKRRKGDVEQAIEELTRTMSIVSGMLKGRGNDEPQPLLDAAE